MADDTELLEVAVDRARVGCASIVTESARSIPASPARALGGQRRCGPEGGVGAGALRPVVGRLVAAERALRARVCPPGICAVGGGLPGVAGVSRPAMPPPRRRDRGPRRAAASIRPGSPGGAPALNATGPPGAKTSAGRRGHDHRAGVLGGMPMSTTSIRPANALVPTCSPTFGAWLVAVSAARTTSPSALPVEASRPDGTSAATVGRTSGPRQA